MDVEKLGKRIRSERRKRDLTQEELGKMVGAKKTSVCQWEKGLNMPRVEVLLKVLEVLKIKI